MTALQRFLLFTLLTFGGMALEALVYKYIHKKHTSDFSIKKFMYFYSLPLLAVILLTLEKGILVLIAYCIFALIGLSLEWLFGYCYHAIFGKRLWTYHQYPLNGYTSSLSLPLWGTAGLLFWLLVKIFV